VNRYFCRVEYDGSQFSGWQVQPDRITVQSVLEEKMGIISQQRVATICGGRTDAGVHGRGQSVHFDLDGEIDCYRFQKGVNSLLPDSVAIFDLQPVHPEFHARFDATHREYLYTITTRKSPLMKNHANYVSFPIDWERVQREVGALTGEHVFTSFCSVGYYSDNHRCNVELAEIAFPSPGVVTFRIRADRFVYKMVRTVVGTLIDMGRGKIKESMKDIIAAEERGRAGATAPSQGLTFEWVYYDELA
jgi:tRNA pseudouridine38-40 synthase